MQEGAGLSNHLLWLHLPLGKPLPLLPVSTATGEGTNHSVPRPPYSRPGCTFALAGCYLGLGN